MSARTIEITVSPRGEVKVQTRGFTGNACREATRRLEEALGTKTAETLTAEFHAAQNARRTLEQKR